MRIMVTGGAGFIGSNFIYYLLEHYPSYEVMCLDSLTYAGNRETLKEAERNSRFCFVRADITDREAVYQAVEEFRPDVAVNFAAESHVDRSISAPELFLDTNIKGTAVLLDACLRYRVARFHQISTDEVYGDLSLDEKETAFTEDFPLKASSPYGASKAGADLLTLAYARTYGLPATISRCSNNYGPYQFPEKLIPMTIIHALKGEPIPVYGDGKNVRDWIYVEDHCRAVDAVIHRGIPGNVYNIGAGQEISNLELVRSICQELGKSQNLITFVEDRKGHDRRYAVNAGKIKKELSWRPEVEFKEGLRKTVRWYLEHREWWEKL